MEHAKRPWLLINDVFANGYIAAMRPTLAISVAILLVGAAACTLLRRRPAVVAPAVGPGADPAAPAAPAVPEAGQAAGATQAEPSSTR